METEEIKIPERNEIYIHKASDNFYLVLEVCKMKHPDNGKWIDCVVYESIKFKEHYVRSLDSFVNNFTLAM